MGLFIFFGSTTILMEHLKTINTQYAIFNNQVFLHVFILEYQRHYWFIKQRFARLLMLIDRYSNNS